MSRSLKVATYPAAFLALAGEFEGQSAKRSRTLACRSKSEAVKLRLDLYGFRRALAAERMTEDYPNFVTCRMFVAGKTLTIKHADDCVPPALRQPRR